MRNALIAACFGLCACATPSPSADAGFDPPTGASIGWICTGGASFSIRLTESGNVEVKAGRQTYRLPGVVAGSGTRYTDGTVEYWEHSGEAFLRGAAGGPYESCTRPE